MTELILQLSNKMAELISQFTPLEILFYIILAAIGIGLITGISLKND